MYVIKRSTLEVMAPRFLYAVSNKNSGEKLLNSAAQYLRLPVEEKEKWELLHQAKCYAVQRFLTKTIRSVRYLKSPYQVPTITAQLMCSKSYFIYLVGSTSWFVV